MVNGQPGTPMPVKGPATRALPPAMTLAIGSMPHTDPALAVDRILEACPMSPCWPQLPALGFQENMLAQFSEGLPCLQIDWNSNRIFFARPEGCPEELASFYQQVLEAEETGSVDAFRLSRSFAKGLYAFLDRFAEPPGDAMRFTKGQITGPLTFGLSVKDEQGLPALFDDTLADVVRKGILMKALWQAECLASCGKPVILFVDEPVLAAFGSSAYVNLSRQMAVEILRETFQPLQEKGVIVGSHCCGNTDWGVMVEAGVDIINFDAFQYGSTIALYAEAIAEFLEAGGSLAWGIVPSESMDHRPAPEDLLEMLAEGMDLLRERGLTTESLLSGLLLTTSCGLGTLSEAEADAALRELRELHALVLERMVRY